MVAIIGNNDKELCNFSLGVGYIELLLVPQMSSHFRIYLLASLCSSFDYLLPVLQDSEVSFPGKTSSLKPRIGVFCFPLLVYLLYANFFVSFKLIFIARTNF